MDSKSVRMVSRSKQSMWKTNLVGVRNPFGEPFSVWNQRQKVRGFADLT